jgi:hypothetical protein
VTKAGDVGRDGENKVRDYLIEQGYEYAKRIRLKGQYDEGDVVLGDGYPVAIEVKAGQGALKVAHSAGRELIEEIENAGAEIGFCVIKKARSAKVDEWLVVIPMSEYIGQLKQMYPPRES